MRSLPERNPQRRAQEQGQCRQRTLWQRAAASVAGTGAKAAPSTPQIDVNGVKRQVREEKGAITPISNTVICTPLECISYQALVYRPVRTEHYHIHPVSECVGHSQGDLSTSWQS